MGNKKFKLTLIIPCYNESDNIKILIDRISIIKYFIDEKILVNNGSNDTTRRIAEKLIYGKSNYKLINIEIIVGYGDGIVSGVRYASGDIITLTGADLQTDPQDVIDAFNTYVNYPKDFLLDLYLLYIAKINPYKVYEHPVYFKKRVLGMSKGGWTILGKIYLIKNTIKYILNLKSKMKK